MSTLIIRFFIILLDSGPQLEEDKVVLLRAHLNIEHREAVHALGENVEKDMT